MYSVTNNSNTVQTGFDYTSLNQKQTVAKSDMEQQQDRFMKLLVKQLQSQDPLNPMDSAATTSQMAQINTVTQLSKLNDTMSALMSGFNNMQSMQASGMIGKSVMGSGSTLNYQGAATDFQVNFPTLVNGGVVQIIDSSGAVVREISFGSQSSTGDKTVSWDGKRDDGTAAANGSYQVRAFGQQTDGKAVALPTKTWQKVDSIAMSGGTAKVVLADGTAIALSSITQVR